MLTVSSLLNDLLCYRSILAYKLAAYNAMHTINIRLLCLWTWTFQVDQSETNNWLLWADVICYLGILRTALNYAYFTYTGCSCWSCIHSNCVSRSRLMAFNMSPSTKCYCIPYAFISSFSPKWKNKHFSYSLYWRKCSGCFIDKLKTFKILLYSFNKQ